MIPILGSGNGTKFPSPTTSPVLSLKKTSSPPVNPTLSSGNRTKSMSPISPANENHLREKNIQLKKKNQKLQNRGL